MDAQLVMKWLDTAAGQGLLEQERLLAAVALERVFGDQIIQIGSWGPPGQLLEAARTQFTAVLGDSGEPGVGAIVAAQRLAILTDSVDAVILPHTLELSAEPHAVLREVHRILRPDGKLIILGFNPVSWWGVRHQIALNGYPAGVRRQISRRRLADWLRLLNLSIDSVSPCYASAPENRVTTVLQRSRILASAYLMVATKETIPMTIIRPKVRPTARLVESLVNPTSRNAA